MSDRLIAEGLFYAGQQKLELADLDGARASFLQALEVDPTLPHAHYGLARVAQTQADDEDEQRHLERFLETAPTDDELAGYIPAVEQRLAVLAAPEQAEPLAGHSPHTPPAPEPDPAEALRAQLAGFRARASEAEPGLRSATDTSATAAAEAERLRADAVAAEQRFSQIRGSRERGIAGFFLWTAVLVVLPNLVILAGMAIYQVVTGNEPSGEQFDTARIIIGIVTVIVTIAVAVPIARTRSRALKTAEDDYATRWEKYQASAERAAAAESDYRKEQDDADAIRARITELEEQLWALGEAE